jgi:hypothetical protein
MAGSSIDIAITKSFVSKLSWAVRRLMASRLFCCPHLTTCFRYSILIFSYDVYEALGEIIASLFLVIIWMNPK